MAKGNRGGKRANGSDTLSYDAVISKIENRSIIGVKEKNAIIKELKLIYPLATVTMTSVNVGSWFYEASNGKMKILSVDMGTRYNANNRNQILTSAFKVLEKYNLDFKFDYIVDKKKYRSDGSNFENSRNSIYNLYGIKTKNGTPIPY